MRSVTGWARMMNQTVSIAAPSSADVYGERSYGSAVSYRCRLVGKRTLVRDTSGREVVSKQTLYLMTPNVIDPESLITLSTGDVGSTEGHAINPPILSVGRYPDDAGGFHHSVLYLG